jgi:succinyl-diaminopimelate desuccinylase
MVEAGRLLASRRDLWRGTLVLMFVADEEIDGGGSRILARQQPRPDLIVIGEPTNNAVYAAHKGVCGRLSAPKARPRMFDARDRELRAQTHPLVGHASLTVTRIAGGIADNVVPDNCEIVLDRRLLPGETLDAALARSATTAWKRSLRRSVRWPGRRRPQSTIRSCVRQSLSRGGTA